VSDKKTCIFCGSSICPGRNRPGIDEDVIDVRVETLPEELPFEVRMHPDSKSAAVVAPEIEFNPRQAFVFKNVGEAREDVFILPKHVDEQIKNLMLEQAARIECHLVRWIAGAGPGGHIGELVMEDHQSADPLSGTDCHVIRVKAGPYWGPGQAGAGPIVAVVPGIKIKVVDE
jgi:hypothetical protein